MKPHFHYSSDIYGINAKEIADCCVHLICLEGGGSFVFNGKEFSLTKNCILVVPNPAKIENVNASLRGVILNMKRQMRKKKHLIQKILPLFIKR